MTTNLLALLAFGGFMASCNSNDNKASADKSFPAADTLECYADTTNGDRVFLQIHIKGDEITGNLDYHIREKDQNHGTIRGKMKGDTLLADYFFLSEGTRSIRQVAFLKRGNSLLEGYGNIEEQNGKTVFKKDKGLSFGNGIILEKGTCGE